MFKVTVLQKGECKEGFCLLGRESEIPGKRKREREVVEIILKEKNTCENESERKQRGGERGGKREREG